MADKPSYIGLLNAIAVGEMAAGTLFDEWAETTTDKRFQKTLRLVAMRESEHGLAFSKRLMELGYDVRHPDHDPGAEQRKIVSSNRSDASKLRALKFHRGPGATDVFDSMFQDKTLDPVTGGLLGRYIAEERDTGWKLKAEYDRINAREQKAKERAATKSKAKPKPKAKS